MTRPMPGVNGRLDCGCFESALQSCGNLLCIKTDDLLKSLSAFRYESVSCEDRGQLPYPKLLLRAACGIEWRDLPTPATIYWFHATRATPDSTFQDGLLPLNQRLEYVWHFLSILASEWSDAEEWGAFRSSMHGHEAQLIQLKTGSNLDGGPFAFLVRDFILQPPAATHNYLRMPEIVEDICVNYESRFGRPLAERFQSATQACIVKFQSSACRSDAVGAALMYVHRIAIGEDLFSDCNTCYDGGGSTIPRSEILGLEWHEDTQTRKESAEPIA